MQSMRMATFRNNFAMNRFAALLDRENRTRDRPRLPERGQGLSDESIALLP